MYDSIFSKSFIDYIKNILNKHCPKDKCLTRAEFLELLDIDSKWHLEGAVKHLIDSGTIDGFKVYNGPYGGVGRVKYKPKKKSNNSSVEITDEFKTQLMVALDDLCPYGSASVPRDVIAYYMGIRKAVNLISQALKLKEFNNFIIKVGRGGGIKRIKNNNIM